MACMEVDKCFVAFGWVAVEWYIPRKCPSGFEVGPMIDSLHPGRFADALGRASADLTP